MKRNDFEITNSMQLVDSEIQDFIVGIQEIIWPILYDFENENANIRHKKFSY